MSDDAKEWKTVKIEAPVRDDAQADPRTYSEIMRAGLNETPAEPVTAEMPDLEDKITEILDGGVDDTTERMVDLADQLDRIEDAAREATNAAQNAERAAEELQR